VFRGKIVQFVRILEPRVRLETKPYEGETGHTELGREGKELQGSLHSALNFWEKQAGIQIPAINKSQTMRTSKRHRSPQALVISAREQVYFPNYNFYFLGRLYVTAKGPELLHPQEGDGANGALQCLLIWKKKWNLRKGEMRSEGCKDHLPTADGREGGKEGGSGWPLSLTLYWEPVLTLSPS
jgi:hypothetical protein